MWLIVFVIFKTPLLTLTSIQCIFYMLLAQSQMQSASATGKGCLFIWYPQCTLSGTLTKQKHSLKISGYEEVTGSIL